MKKLTLISVFIVILVVITLIYFFILDNKIKTEEQAVNMVKQFIEITAFEKVLLMEEEKLTNYRVIKLQDIYKSKISRYARCTVPI